MKDNSEPLVVMIRESGLPENSDDVRDIYKKAEKNPYSGQIRGLLYVVCHLLLSSDPLKQFVDERVHDANGLEGDTGVWVDLLQDFVDVGLLPPLLLLLLVSLLDGLGGLSRLLSSLSGNLGGHVDAMSCTVKLTGMCRDGGVFIPDCETAGDGVPSARVPGLLAVS